MARGLRASLLHWYDSSARDLPWRHTRDPYSIWVSEIMLQQTRVDTVLRYYSSFLDRFPDAHALARAPQDQVMAAWSGLGYYRRARLLHQGVREVVERYGGKVPVDPEQRLALPGIGRYTAGAIGSIAFGRQEPLVDGNVGRVFSRLFLIETPLGRSDTERALWSKAEQLVVGKRPGDLNQAIMELGATVCTKGEPDCDVCPVRRHCLAKEAGNQGQLPVRKAKPAPTRVPLVAVLATRGDGDGLRLWLKHGSGSLFGGLWNLPMADGQGRAAAREVLKDCGLSGRLGQVPEGQLEHVLSHRRLLVEVWRARAVRGPGHVHQKAVALDALDSLGTSSLTRKCVQYL